MSREPDVNVVGGELLAVIPIELLTALAVAPGA